ncbi:MAG: hypothetical protein ACERKO_05185 [Acetanaerobacterium sp.]
MANKRIVSQIFAAGYRPYYDSGRLFIFQNERGGGLQFYSASFEARTNEKTAQLVFTQIEGLSNLLQYKHLMPEDMQKNLIAAAKRQGIYSEVQNIG